MLIGARPGPALEACFWVSKIKVIFSCVFGASPSGTEGFGHEFLGHNWAFVSHVWLIFGHLNISRVLEGS